MNVYGLLPVFKVVEINNSVSIRSGHIIAQAELAKADYLDGEQQYVENGYVFYMDVDGKLKTPSKVNADIRKFQKPLLHFTEELFTTGLSEELRHFAVEFNDENIAYPRCLFLNIGDTFTTNNFVGTVATATVAIISNNGQFALYANLAAAKSAVANYVGPLFHVLPSTLPDGETAAPELTVLAEVVSFA